jgi:hypothetical protein
MQRLLNKNRTPSLSPKKWRFKGSFFHRTYFEVLVDELLSWGLLLYTWLVGNNRTFVKTTRQEQTAFL